VAGPHPQPLQPHDVPRDHSGHLPSCTASSQSVPRSRRCGKKSQDSAGVPHSAVLTGHVSSTGAACSFPAWEHVKAGGTVPPRRLLLNPLLKEYLWAPFRNICSVNYSVFPNLPYKISVSPLTQFLFVPHNTQRYCLSIAPGRPSDVPWWSPRCTEPVSSTAGVEHSLSQEPCSALTFPGEFR